jgi:hypothetical protein
MTRPIASTGSDVTLIGNCHTPLEPAACCTTCSPRRTAYSPMLNERPRTLGMPKDTPIDFAHLLVDVSGKTSLRKCGEALALLASTWIVLWMASLKTLTETIFLGYVLIWAARSAIGPLIAARAGSIATRALSASRVDNPDQ